MLTTTTTTTTRWTQREQNARLDFDELESRNGNVDRQTNGQTNTQNYTNFERNLAMMVIYLPVKFEFDFTNRFRVTVRKQKF